VFLFGFDKFNYFLKKINIYISFCVYNKIIFNKFLHVYFYIGRPQQNHFCTVLKRFSGLETDKESEPRRNAQGEKGVVRSWGDEMEFALARAHFNLFMKNQRSSRQAKRWRCRGGALITAICLRHCTAKVVDPVYGVPLPIPQKPLFVGVNLSLALRRLIWRAKGHLSESAPSDK